MENKKNKIRGQITLKLLEIIQERADNVLDHFIAYMNCNKRSISSFEYELERIQLYPKGINKRYWRTRFNNMIYKLKKDGLIEKKSSRFLLTVSGKLKLTKLKASTSRNKFLGFCKKKQSTTLKVIAFDIPERLKKERDWLRFLLRKLGFVMVQKSLWVGKVKLPKEFFEELYNQKIDRYIKIFTVDKKGNLID